MAKFKIKLQDKKEVAKDTMAFYFEKPMGYTYQAGQHTGWTLINPPETDAEGNARTFSFASAPHENFLMIASRLRDTAFKRVLHNLPVGSELEIEEPFGDFVLPASTQLTESTRSASSTFVFLAGGIGITPFRSLVLDASRRHLPNQIYLFYSNRTPQDAPFLDELKKVEKLNYKLIPVFTKQTGYITKEILSQSLGNLITPVYFVAGPTQFVLAMRDLLIPAGVDDLSIKSEEFEGY